MTRKLQFSSTVHSGAVFFFVRLLSPEARTQAMDAFTSCFLLRLLSAMSVVKLVK
jgi:hypothetical protein